LKNKGAIYLLFAANSISGFAQGISMIAIPWYFSNVLGMPSRFGNIYLLVTFVSLFWGIYVGGLVDKYNRKNLFMLTSVFGAVALLSASASGFVTGQVPWYMVAMVFGCTVFVYNIHYPSLYAFAQEITAPKDYGRITSYLEVQGQTTSALAGALAAILMKGTENGLLNLFGFYIPIGFDFSAWTMHEIFLLDGITYIISLSLVSMMRFTPVAVRYAENVNVWKRLKTGIDFLMNNRLIFIFGTFGASVFVAILVIGFYLGPIYIDKHLHRQADVYASYNFYFAIGSILAGLFIQKFFSRWNEVAGVIALSFVAATVYIICMFHISLGVLYTIAFMEGLANAGSRVLRVSFQFKHIPNQVIGRTTSVFVAINVLFRLAFVGIFSMPFFMASNNVIYAFLGFAVFIIISALILMRYYRPLVNLPYRE
jgi:MFS transporter, DHA3 family, macrolide efflux protein